MPLESRVVVLDADRTRARPLVELLSAAGYDAHDQSPADTPRDADVVLLAPDGMDAGTVTRLATSLPDAELLLLDSVLQHQAGQFAAAANSLRNLLKKGQKPLLGEIDVARYRKACGNLIALLRKLGRTTEADEWLVRVAREDPAYLPAGIAAGGMLLKAGRLDELEELLALLEAAHANSADLALLRGEALVARGQTDRAREHLRAAMSRVTQPERVRAALGRLS